MNTKAYLRNGVYRVLYHAMRGREHNVAILLYHSIGDSSVNHPCIAETSFDVQMRFLSRHYRVIPVRDLPEELRHGPPQENLACVTFDDGRKDNLEFALPILDKYSIKATYFIASGFIGANFPSSQGPIPMMDQGAIRELSKQQHEIGAHTVSHPQLTKIDVSEAYHEIKKSKHDLEDISGSAVVSFAYPKGDYNDNVQSLLKQLHFKVGVTTNRKIVKRNEDWLELPRIQVSEDLSTSAFRAEISPVVESYMKLRQLLRI